MKTQLIDIDGDKYEYLPNGEISYTWKPLWEIVSTAEGEFLQYLFDF